MNERRKLIIAISAGALMTPLASLAQAQNTRLWRIGIMGPGSSASNVAYLAGLQAELRALGYVEGRNLALEVRWSEGANDRLPGFAAELVALKVDAIIVVQTPSAQAAKQATQTIPIILGAVADPVAAGLVASLARPAGNITGMAGATTELAAKTLELVRDMLPATKRVGLLANADDPFTKTFVDSVEGAGRQLAIAVQPFMLRGEAGMDAAFEQMTKAKVNAVIVQPSLPQKRAADLAVKHRLPAASPTAFFTDAGGLLGYAANSAERFRVIAFYVDRILKGAKPADLPVQQPTRFELIINLKVAKAIGLTVPQSFLARADRVIE